MRSDVLRDWLIGESGKRSHSEKLYSFLGGFVGILVTTVSAIYFLGVQSASLLLIASMGASAVLLFCVPHGPLSQPWPFVGGHLISAFIGVSCSYLIPEFYIAAPASVALAILAMQYTHCVHPPGGATALSAVVGGPIVHSLGYKFVWTPVGINVLFLLIATLIVNNLIPGRWYPVNRRSSLPTDSSHDHLKLQGITLDDIHAAVSQIDTFIDVTEEDLASIYTMASIQSQRRRMGEIYCKDAMTTEVISVEFGTELEEVWRLLAHHRIKSVPVIDRARRVIGIVSISDFLNQVRLPDENSTLMNRLVSFIRRTPGLFANKPEVAGQIMTEEVVTVFADDPISVLFPVLYQKHIHHIQVIDQDQRLVGIITTSDMMSAIY